MNKYFQQAIAFHKAGDLKNAVESYRKARRQAPREAQLLYLLGTAEAQLGNYAEAIQLLTSALQINPNIPSAYNSLGIALKEVGRLQDALQAYDRALNFSPGHPEVLNNRGVVLRELKRAPEAIASHEQAIRLRPDFVEAHNNLGIAHYDLKQYERAVQCYEHAIRLRPDFAMAHCNLGIVFQELKHFDQALASFEVALRLDPEMAAAHYNQGMVLQELKRHEDALASYSRAFELKPNLDFLHGHWLHAKMQLCDWQGVVPSIDQLASKIDQGLKAATPLICQALLDSPELQRKCAAPFAAMASAGAAARPTVAPAASARPERIRIGYFSADFGDHPVTHLITGVIEAHDRSRFEIMGFSLAPRAGEWRDRVARAFDQFIDASAMTDDEVAAMAHALALDVAIDLNGYTQNCRPGIFARRAAPIQVSYLGYLGTMSAEFIDYLIVDPAIVPDGSESLYPEKLIVLPCYQCNDRNAVLSEEPISRAQVGLPEQGFVYAAFNNSYKITPDTFDAWMRILAQVPDSVLWLYARNPTTIDNLRRAAQARGIEQERIVFAGYMPRAQHLRRLQLADLFLDTFPCNAGATASDALRAGLPILTRAGSAFASRVGASVLNAVGLPDMVTQDMAGYEAKAVQLGNDPALIREVRARLARQLPDCALFDTPRFTGHLERAFLKLIAQRTSGTELTTIRVS